MQTNLNKCSTNVSVQTNSTIENSQKTLVSYFSRASCIWEFNLCNQLCWEQVGLVFIKLENEEVNMPFILTY